MKRPSEKTVQVSEGQVPLRLPIFVTFVINRQRFHIQLTNILASSDFKETVLNDTDMYILVLKRTDTY